LAVPDSEAEEKQNEKKTFADHPTQDADIEYESYY
jgi:hypothetical protein